MSEQKSKEKLGHPPKELKFPADWNALEGYGSILRNARAKQHHSRMSKARQK